MDKTTVNYRFGEACRYGDLKKVRHYLTSKKLQRCAAVNSNRGRGLCLACENGHLEVVKYLLTSSELSVHADIRHIDIDTFTWMCANGHFEVVKYLMTSPELDQHLYIDMAVTYEENLANSVYMVERDRFFSLLFNALGETMAFEIVAALSPDMTNRLMTEKGDYILSQYDKFAELYPENILPYLPTREIMEEVMIYL